MQVVELALYSIAQNRAIVEKTAMMRMMRTFFFAQYFVERQTRIRRTPTQRSLHFFAGRQLAVASVGTDDPLDASEHPS